MPCAPIEVDVGFTRHGSPPFGRIPVCICLTLCYISYLQQFAWFDSVCVAAVSGKFGCASNYSQEVCVESMCFCRTPGKMVSHKPSLLLSTSCGSQALNCAGVNHCLPV